MQSIFLITEMKIKLHYDQEEKNMNNLGEVNANSVKLID